MQATNSLTIVGTPPLFKGGDHNFQGLEEGGGSRFFLRKGGDRKKGGD